MAERSDEEYMRQALKLARKGAGCTSPNPMVGALLVKGSRIVGRGYHKKAGEAHAEVNAIAAAGRDARGSTLYVTLEPCNHHGKTPPCTEAVIGAGIRRVVAGMSDPNPNVIGGGLKFLESRGIAVGRRVLEEECRRLNEAFITYVEKKRPFVIVKTAASLDGRIATRTGDSKWITGERARRFVHSIRNQVDAILVGVDTVVRDNPMLTARLGLKRPRDPARVVLDSRLRTPPDSRILNLDSFSSTLLITGPEVSQDRKEAFTKANVEIISVSRGDTGLNLLELLTRLAKRGILTVLVEGGGTVIDSFIKARLVDKFYFFYAPILIGGRDAKGMVEGDGIERIADGLRLRDLRTRRIGNDLLIEAYPDY
ncbi:MAG: bifunctional diaminohydroxyphosphoribosylaminopyrimidine deaminase/5-amino-6-(5-phosphoribosylamino)uracil reductase RibD [Pseudomonadota bacterium]